MIKQNDLIEFHYLRELKYRYIRALDTQNWELMEQCFTEDAYTWYAGGKVAQRGRREIVGLLREMLPASVASSHLAVHPELELTSDYSAKGIWRMQDSVFYTAPVPAYRHVEIRGGEMMNGAAYYHEEYLKQDGCWKISSLGYVRIYETIERGEPHEALNLTVEPSRGMTT
jgi:hypothetical protein